MSACESVVESPDGRLVRLTAAMQRAIDLAQSNDGKLHRHKGGFWGTRNSHRNINARTVGALVQRGLAEFTDHRTGKHGRFAVELTLTLGGWR